jgi:eukaryotic-like serine/threonine-protein kinase
MKTHIASDSLVETIRVCRILEDPQLDALAREQWARIAGPDELARELLRRGWLTHYQVDQLARGRGGDLVLGAYLILDALGEGGMGRVLKARHRRMNRTVALKVIRPEHLARPGVVGRFHCEIEAAARLSHPNIVIAYDADEVDGTHFLVMEYVKGIDLARLVGLGGPLDPASVCDYIRQASLGLQHAHEQGLIHRDVKPSNLMLTAEGPVIKVLDLGLARLLGDGRDGRETEELTGHGVILGTPDYLASEQAEDVHAADVRSDVYSLGCTLYHLLTGAPPFGGLSVVEKLLQHRGAEPAPVEAVRAGLPPGLGPVVRKMMAKRPEDRFQAMAQVAEALGPFCRGGQRRGLETPGRPRKAGPGCNEAESSDITIQGVSVPAGDSEMRPGEGDLPTRGCAVPSPDLSFPPPSIGGRLGRGERLSPRLIGTCLLVGLLAWGIMVCLEEGRGTGGVRGGSLEVLDTDRSGGHAQTRRPHGGGRPTSGSIRPGPRRSCHR